MLSELNLGLNDLYLKHNKDVTTDINGYLEDLEHILNTGQSVLDSVLKEDQKLIDYQNKS